MVARRRPDFARLRRGQPSGFFTTRPGAPKRSDGGLVLEKLSNPIQSWMEGMIAKRPAADEAGGTKPTHQTRSPLTSEDGTELDSSAAPSETNLPN